MTNPFNAGFGVPPPYFAGRAGLLHHVLANLQDGPGRAAYLQVLLGGRGVGKTVLLNEIRDRVTEEFGWATVRWTAGPDESLAATLRDAFDDTVRELRGRSPRVAGGTVGLNLGVARAELDIVRDQSRPTTVVGLLRRLGRLALSVNRQVVLLVDELQAGDAASIRAFLPPCRRPTASDCRWDLLLLAYRRHRRDFVGSRRRRSSNGSAPRRWATSRWLTPATRSRLRFRRAGEATTPPSSI